MDLPEFETPKTTPPPTPPSSVPPSLQPPQVARSPVANLPLRRAWALVTLPIVALFATALGAFLMLRTRPLPKSVVSWAKSVDPAATGDAKAQVDQREGERLTRKIAEVRALVERVRSVRGRRKDAQALSGALDAAAALVENLAFEQADKRIEEVKKALPPLPVSNPLPVAPKPIDVPAPPKEKIVAPKGEGAPPAKVSRKKKPVKKKARKPAP